MYNIIVGFYAVNLVHTYDTWSCGFSAFPSLISLYQESRKLTNDVNNPYSTSALAKVTITNQSIPSGNHLSLALYRLDKATSQATIEPWGNSSQTKSHTIKSYQNQHKEIINTRIEHVAKVYSMQNEQPVTPNRTTTEPTHNRRPRTKNKRHPKAMIIIDTMKEFIMYIIFCCCSLWYTYWIIKTKSSFSRRSSSLIKRSRRILDKDHNDWWYWSGTTSRYIQIKQQKDVSSNWRI